MTKYAIANIITIAISQAKLELSSVGYSLAAVFRLGGLLPRNFS
jgi:hypothetical protein